MAGLLRAGAGERGATDWRGSQAEAAAFVVDFCAGGYGPNGAAKLVVAQDGNARWVRSPALALRESATGPMLAPYADLAGRLHRHAGDQSTGALLLTARLVQAALGAGAPPVAAWIEGYRLAARQARGWLAAHAVQAGTADALSAVAPREWAAVVAGALPRLGQRGGEAIDLDAVDVRAGPDGPAWLDGVVVEPQGEPRKAGPAAVLMLAGGWSVKPRSEGLQATARDPAALARLGAAEEARRERAAEHVLDLGVGLVAAAAGLDDGLRGRLASRGVAVWTDVPRSALDRLRKAGGGALVARLEDTAPADLGHGELVRRPRPRGDGRGWLLRGDGPSATFAVPAGSEVAKDAAVEQAERLLRAAGLVLAKPGALPGGGRWQRGLAASLRSAADAAPRHAPIAVRAAAEAVDALAGDLLRNAGRDALAGGLPPGADAVLDAAACVRLAVDGAFETAIALLRLDAAYSKRPSSAADMRGGTGRAGSPKGMPGDVPPLM